MLSKHYQLIKATEIRVLLLKKQSRVSFFLRLIEAFIDCIILWVLEDVGLQWDFNGTIR